MRLDLAGSHRLRLLAGLLDLDVASERGPQVVGDGEHVTVALGVVKHDGLTALAQSQQLEFDHVLPPLSPPRVPSRRGKSGQAPGVFGCFAL